VSGEPRAGKGSIAAQRTVPSSRQLTPSISWSLA
jgi:hypothetical protein